MLADIIPDTVGVVNSLPSKGTEVDSQGELIEILDGLLYGRVVSGVVIGVMLGQLRSGQTTNIDDRAAYWTWK